MRPLVLSLLVLGLAAPAHAQSAFVEACQVSQATPDGDPCGCGVARALGDGMSGVEIDALVPFTAADRLWAPGVPPTFSRAVGTLSGHVWDCAVAASADGERPERQVGVEDPALTMAKGGTPATAPPDAPLTPEAIAAEAVRAAAPLPIGLRTGNGTDPVQARQQGKGAPIRIVG